MMTKYFVAKICAHYASYKVQWGPFLHLKNGENRTKREVTKKRAFSEKNWSLKDFKDTKIGRYFSLLYEK